MNILVINTGSSSLKYQLFDMDQAKAMAGGVVERIGEPQGIMTHKDFTGSETKETKFEEPIADHKVAMDKMAALITLPIDAVGHRVVQGGEAFQSAVVITDEVKKAIEANNSLAPLHNPANLVGIQVAQELFAGKPQVAVFDTNFHQTMPAHAYMYALPYSCYEKYRIRRYGFHGTSHKYVAARAASLMGKPLDSMKLITLHLGNGCSISAVRNGKCQDTTMGMTPLAGVMMGTRTGDIDPAIFGFLMDQTGKTREEVDTLLNKESGLKGICGYNDLRDIHAQVEKGNDLAILALEMFTSQIKKSIGAYAAALGGVDGLVFTAGVGENDSIAREKILANLEFLGVEADLEKNAVFARTERPIHKDGSKVQVWVIPTNEELQIAQETMEIL